jgi:hypothetical protein
MFAARRIHGYLRLIVLSAAIFAASAAAADTQSGPNKLCRISVSIDPSFPQTMNEYENLTATVTAKYEGQTAQEIRLLAVDLPDFASGWSNNETACSDCVLADTILFHPAYCDSGSYRFTLIAAAGPIERLADTVDCVLTVNNVDQPCVIDAGGPYSVIAGRQLDFEVTIMDADSICSEEISPALSYSGYPFQNGAVMDSGGFAWIFSWLPGVEDTGSHTVSFSAGVGASVCDDSTVITVEPIISGCVDGPPVIVPEPVYTQGTSNRICYRPSCGAYEHQVCYIDSSHNPGVILGCRLPESRLSLADSDTMCSVIEDLHDGHTYGYMVAAYFAESPDSILFSDTTYSTQDNTPPDSVAIDSARAYAGGIIGVYWSGVLDHVSYVDKYEVYRKEDGQSHSLIAITPATSDNDTTTHYVYLDSLGGGTGLA